MNNHFYQVFPNYAFIILLQVYISKTVFDVVHVYQILTWMITCFFPVPIVNESFICIDYCGSGPSIFTILFHYGIYMSIFQ